MAKGRGRPWPRPAAGDLTAWPLDEPEPAPTPAATTDPASPATPGTQPGDDFFCRHCRTAQTSPLPPDGWYRLQQRHQIAARMWFTKGLYCSAECLVADMATGR